MSRPLFTYDELLIRNETNKKPEHLARKRKCRKCKKHVHETSYYFCSDHMEITNEWDDDVMYASYLGKRK